MRTVLKTLLLCGALMLFAAPTWAATVVVMSASSSVDAMSKSDLSALYLGRTTALPNGDNAKLYDLASSDAAREGFYQAVTGKSASQVKATWSRLVFSGRAVPPVEKNTSAAVVKAVAADPDAVGYVDSSAVDGSVKVVYKVQ